MKFKLIIDKENEEEIVARVHRESELTARLENIVREFEGADCLVVYGEDDMLRLPFSNIECITVLDRKIIAVDREGKQYRIKQRLFEVEELLPSYFVRINKSSIANTEHIARFKSAFSGAVDVIFKCGYRDYVSRRCLPTVKRRFE